MIDCLKKKPFIKRKFSSQKNLKSEVISRKFVVVARKEKKLLDVLCIMYPYSIQYILWLESSSEKSFA